MDERGRDRARDGGDVPGGLPGDADAADGTGAGGATPAGRGAGGAARGRLERPPSDRYRAAGPVPGAAAPGGSAGAGAPRSATARTIAAAGASALLLALAGQVTLGPGLLALAGFGGWLVAAALDGSGGSAVGRRGRAAGLAIAAVAGALLLDSLLAVALGGVLDPAEYVAARHGVGAVLLALAAAGVAALRVR